MALSADLASSNRLTIIYTTIIFGLAYMLTDNSLVSEASRWITVSLLNLIGMPATDTGTAIVLGNLELKWTDDCSGVNALLMLWALCLWANRNLPISASVTRLVLCIPLAFAVNTARVLSIAAYRHIYYPAWETPELHYFIGIAWLLPCLPLLVKDFRGKSMVFWTNLFYGATVLSMVAPALLNPGGLATLLCVLLIMSRNGIQTMTAARWTLTIFWILSGVLVAASATESLWLPWLLLSPLFLDRAHLRSWAFPILMAGTISLVSMIDLAFWVLISTACVVGVIAFREGVPSEPEPRLHPAALLIACLTLTTPLLAPSVLPQTSDAIAPPAGLFAKQTSANGYQFQVIGQSPEISSFWFGPFSDGRHHSLLSCLTFRGVELEQVNQEPSVFVGEGKWMTEFFIHNGQLQNNYFQYLLASLTPFSSPGVHLIFEAPADSMSAVIFRMEATRASEAATRIYLRN